MKKKKFWILKQRKAVKNDSPANSQSSHKNGHFEKKILKSLHPSKFAFMGITKGRKIFSYI